MNCLLKLARKQLANNETRMTEAQFPQFPQKPQPLTSSGHFTLWPRVISLSIGEIIQ